MFILCVLTVVTAAITLTTLAFHELICEPRCCRCDHDPPPGGERDWDDTTALLALSAHQDPAGHDDGGEPAAPPPLRLVAGTRDSA